MTLKMGKSSAPAVHQTKTSERDRSARDLIIFPTVGMKIPNVLDVVWFTLFCFVKI